MASVSGAKSNAILKVATTWGTAVSGGAGNKLKAEITPSFNVNELIAKQIGSGVSMAQYVTRGNIKPTVGLKMDAGYRNCMDNIIAQFMGTSGAPSEVTAGQGDYKHTITFNSTLNSKYLTLAYDTGSATVLEFPTCATSKIGFSLSDAPGILEFSADLLANDVKGTSLAAATNTNASMASATATDTETINYAFEDLFRVNTASGAGLSGSDNYSITGYNFELMRPQEIMGEIKGSAGNGSPIESGLFEGSLSVTVKSLEDHTYFGHWYNETALKCSLNIQGTQIGTGSNKGLTIYIPRMILVEEPSYALASEGINALTLKFRILAATANPTGMTSTYPYFEVINGLSTSLLA